MIIFVKLWGLKDWQFSQFGQLLRDIFRALSASAENQSAWKQFQTELLHVTSLFKIC